MYLKSIEIQGFKSFANRTVFEFHDGITGIVGPNGSGKSNVADAVRWVLGEQSAKSLRGSNMQDVIFAGTEARKAQGYAYVAITFDNHDHTLHLDFNEVTVARRVYRSGESEYLLNKAPCRLKDVHELFFDTGIGKEGYSIIGQGQIDKILSNKPEDRRELFDEAAGIVKFKYRKAAAVKRLENEQENMVRINDIMSELEQRVGPLKRQSENAREYLRLHDALREKEISTFVLDSRQSEENLRQIGERLRIVTQDYEERKRAREALREQYGKEQEELAGAERKLEELRAGRDAVKARENERENRRLMIQGQIETQNLKAQHARERLETLRQNAAKREEENQANEKRRQELSRQIYDANSRLDSMNRQAGILQEAIEENRRKSESGQNLVIDLLNQKSELAATRQRHETTLEQLGSRRKEIEEALGRQGAEKDQALLQMREEEERQKASMKELNAALQRRDSCEDELRQKRSDYERAQSRFAELRRRHQATVTKMEALRNMAERYEGYGSSIRRVMEERDNTPGICGVVADLIHVEQKYETAIETALGGSIQNIVTDTENTAKELIEFLKKNKYGRATFLPLDAITVQQAFGRGEVLREPGILGTANRLVQTDDRYRKVADFLLGRIVVADNIDNAMKAAAKYHRSFRIVTLEGDLLNIGGSMTGGAYRSSTNLLGRNRELEELERLTREENERMEPVKKKIGELYAVSSVLEQSLSELRAEAEEKKVELTRVRMSLEAKKERFSEAEQAWKKASDELEQVRQSETSVRQKWEEVCGKARKLEEDQSSAMQYSDESKAAVLGDQQELDRRRKEIQELELQLATLSQSDSFVTETMKKLFEQEEEERAEGEALNADLEGLAGRLSDLQARMEELAGDTGDSAGKVQELEEEIARTTAFREARGSALAGFFEEQERLGEEIAKLDREQYRLNSQQTKVDEYLDELTSYLWAEYELSPSQAEGLFRETGQSLQQIRREVRALKEQVRNLGPVNIQAIDEYAEVSGRYEFMKKQYDDLTQSRTALLGVIKELEDGMRSQFTGQFARIREEFDRVFREMFGGGKGTIELVEGEDILDAGVMIISQPPGKKLQNMMQLSGGEKALTAIALLFAIQNLKPSPFCLLDEIEAALDESNVGRFSGYLHKLTEHTQFIVITHRRGTMNAADRLYGITMQEKGVSALVSVNLVEEQLDA